MTMTAAEQAYRDQISRMAQTDEVGRAKIAAEMETRRMMEDMAWNCDGWPDWLHKIVNETNEVADRLDMSSEQAHAYAALAAARAEEDNRHG